MPVSVRLSLPARLTVPSTAPDAKEATAPVPRLRVPLLTKAPPVASSWSPAPMVSVPSFSNLPGVKAVAATPVASTAAGIVGDRDRTLVHDGAVDAAGDAEDDVVVVGAR